MRKLFEIGGIVAAAVLIAFGIATIAMGVNGRTTVRDSLKLEQIVGSDDMSPALIKAAAIEAGLPATTEFPTLDVVGKPIDTGERARAFAGYIRIHALEASNGLVYSQMGRFLSAADPKNPAGTSDATLALMDDKGSPVANRARDTWVTATALTTALNTSFMAEQLSLFGIVVGVALLLTGFGFATLAVGGALRNPDTVLGFVRGRHKNPAATMPIA